MQQRRGLFKRSIGLVLAIGVASGCDATIEGDNEDSIDDGTVEDQEADTQVVVQQLAAVGNGDANGVGFDVLTLDNFTGEPEECDPDLAITVGVSFDGPNGPFEPVEDWQTTVTCEGAVDYDVAMVLDNSGSAADSLSVIGAAALEFAAELFDLGGRMSVVRVSTRSEVLVGVTADLDEISTAVEQLHASNGWTALYDAVRLGGETLNAARSPENPTTGPGETVRSCVIPRRHAIAIYTDGQDNNSADEHQCDSCEVPSDGIDTSIADLAAISVDGRPVPIYVVGVGDQVDEAALSSIADMTNGAYLPVEDHAEMFAVLPTIAEYGMSAAHVCVDLPGTECGVVYVQISIDGTADDTGSTSSVHAVDLCPGPPNSGSPTGKTGPLPLPPSGD